MSYSELLKQKFQRPDCFGEPGYYDPEGDDDCKFKCLHRNDCRKIVQRKSAKSKLESKGVPVSLAKTSIGRGVSAVKKKKKNGAVATTQQPDFHNIEIHEEEKWTARLGREMTASGLSAVGYEFGNFFDQGNFRFPFTAKVATSTCPDCDKEVKESDSFCKHCGCEFSDE